MSFTPHSDGTSNRESLMADALRSHIKSYRKMKLNDFIESCGLPPISEVDIDLSSVSERSRRRYIAETREVIEVVLRTLSPSHAAELWEALTASNKMREVFNLPKLEFDQKPNSESSDKYIRALVEAYENASSKNVKKQVLSIIADSPPLREFVNIFQA